MGCTLVQPGNITEPFMIGGPAKTAEPIEMPFGMWTRMGPRNHVLDVVQIAACQRAIFGKEHLRACAPILCRELCKMAEPIEMPFGLWTRMGPRKHVLGGVHNGATWRIPENCPYEVAMRPFCQITLTTCFLLSLLRVFYYDG